MDSSLIDYREGLYLPLALVAFALLFLTVVIVGYMIMRRCKGEEPQENKVIKQIIEPEIGLEMESIIHAKSPTS